MELKIQNSVVQIKVIPIRKYPDLLKKIKVLPKYFNDISGKKNDELFELAPEIIVNCLPDVIAIFSEATSISVEKLNEYGMSDLIDIFIAVIKENRFIEAIEKLKKEFTLKEKPKIEVQNTPSTQ
ncbi:hypothetical protein KKB83_04130 [Patescibacteria group bacterium]|nr:hypothetical protein [Patescibacteria group bacterium]